MHPHQHVGLHSLSVHRVALSTSGTEGSSPPIVQVASSFLIELGNGDKFIWDMGTGSYVNLIATGVPAAKLTKV